MRPDPDRALQAQLYVDRLLEHYVRLPGTPPRASRRDARLARDLHQRQLPLDLVCDALTLAVARRTFRPPQAPPLPAVRTLHYFLPVIEEVQQDRPTRSQIRALEQRLGEISPLGSPPGETGDRTSSWNQVVGEWNVSVEK